MAPSQKVGNNILSKPMPNDSFLIRLASFTVLGGWPMTTTAIGKRLILYKPTDFHEVLYKKGDSLVQMRYAD